MQIKKNLVLALSAAALFASSSVTMAEGMTGEDMYTKCGIGAMLFSDKPVFAAVSNVIWDSGTTAVTSGLAGAGCTGTSAQSAAFILKSYASLESETVDGKGQHLAALMDIYQCDMASRANVINGVRADLANELQDQLAYNQASQLDKAKAYHNSVTTNVATSCNVI